MYNALYMVKALHFVAEFEFDSAKQLFYQAVEQLPITFVETLVAPSEVGTIKLVDGDVSGAQAPACYDTRGGVLRLTGGKRRTFLSLLLS